MGLTIHYNLTTHLTGAKDVRKLVEAVRQFALDLPFKAVGEIKEFKGEDADYQNDSDNDDHWLKIQAGAYVNEEHVHHAVSPTHIIAFSTQPGDGCEDANFGFCKFPAFVAVESPDGRKRRLGTDLKRWRWSSFCKTQYASDPSCGGVQNFVRSHLCVVKLLDFVKQSGLAGFAVEDEGGYWEGRNLEALVKEVGEWNEFIAGFTSIFRSLVEGGTVEAPILGFPNFEHLEAKGLDRLAELHRRLKKPKDGD